MAAVLNMTKRTGEYDFQIGDDLFELECEINQHIKSIVKEKIEVCQRLAGIKLNKLYRQAHIDSFKVYLKENRIILNYSTALDYSIIGEMLIKYATPLRTVGFCEKNGLKKLLLLEKGLQQYKQTPELVFKKMMSLSYRNFKEFVSRKSDPDLEILKIEKKEKKEIKIKAEEDIIFMDPTGTEILWLNMDIEKELGIPDIYKKFQKHIMNSIKEFFHDSNEVQAV